MNAIVMPRATSSETSRRIVFTGFCGAVVVVAALLVTEVAMLGSVSAAFQQCRMIISSPSSTTLRELMGLAPTQGSEKRLGPRIHSLSNRYLFLVIPTGANPDFLPRSARQGRVCAFLLRKGAWGPSTPSRFTGNPGKRSGRTCGFLLRLRRLEPSSRQHTGVHRHASHGIHSNRIQRIDFGLFTNAPCHNQLPPGDLLQPLRHLDREALHGPLPVDMRIEEGSTIRFQLRNRLFGSQRHLFLPSLDRHPT